MRSFALGLVAFSVLHSPALADDLVAIRSGLMCVLPEALGKLTLPDGSSRTAQPNPSSAYLTLKQLGGCIDIAVGMRVSVETAKHNTSVVNYRNAVGHLQTYIVPNIDFEPAKIDVPVQALDPKGTVIQVVIAPGGEKYYYIIAMGQRDVDGVEYTKIEARTGDKGASEVLLLSRPSNEAAQNLDGFTNLVLSPDSKTLYFQSHAWVTSDAIYSIDIATKKVSFVTSGEIACVVLAGQFQGDLIAQQHRYFVQGGSYDYLWLFEPSGKEIGLVGEEINSNICPILKN